MTTATTTIAAMDEDAAAAPSAAEQAFLPYAQLAKMLVPSSGSIGVYQPSGELRWSSDGYERPDLREIVDELGSGSRSGRASIRTTSTGTTAVGARLDNAEGELLGHLVIELPADRTRNSALAINLLNPLVECLRARLSAEQGAAPAASGRMPDDELELLIEVTEIDESGTAALRRLLERSITTLDCEAAAFVSPDPEQSVIVQREASAPAAGNDVIERTRRHLLAWAQLNNRPMIVNRVGDAAGVAPFKILSSPVRIGGGELSGLIALFRSSTSPNFERRDVHLLEFLCRRAVILLTAGSASLPGLVNWQSFEAAVDGGDDGVPGAGGALLQINIDRLQTVNDAFGLDAGDAVIREVAEGLRAAAGDDTIASRLSGDRFALYLPSADQAAAVQAASRLLDDIAARCVMHGEETVPISVSIGIAARESGLTTARELVAAAGAAAIESRRTGGNQYSAYRGAPAGGGRDNRELVAAARLRRALGASQFELLAQPIVAFDDPAGVAGYEVLIRLVDESGALLAPDRFMAVARRYGLALGVDAWVFSELLRRLGGATEALTGLPVGVAVNVSEQSLLSPHYASTVVAGIAASGLPGSAFSFEITESVAIRHVDAAEKFINSVRGAGARVALDGFGSGLTSFARLGRLDVDYLKVAGELIRDRAGDRHVESMVLGLCRAADSLGLPTVAEQVENAAVADSLRAMGFAYGQGFHFGRPAAIATLIGEEARPNDL